MIAPPSATPPRSVASPERPSTKVSTAAASGTAALAKTSGQARRSTCQRVRDSDVIAKIGEMARSAW